MKVQVINKGFTVIPETDFEIDYLRRFLSRKREVVLKSGSNIGDVLAINVRFILEDKKVEYVR